MIVQALLNNLYYREEKEIPMTQSPILIRPLSRPEDFQDIINIWLEASIQSHSFIPASFWESKVADMCNIYLPSSDLYLAVRDQKVCGFYALNGEQLSALFVKPEVQGEGIGSALLASAMAHQNPLILTVYSANQRSIHFYEEHGFQKVSEQVDSETGANEWLMRWEK